MDRGFPFSICLCLKIYIASYKILYRKESIMDNWYKETIAEIKELMEQKGTFYKLTQLQTKALAMRGIE